MASRQSKKTEVAEREDAGLRLRSAAERPEVLPDLLTNILLLRNRCPNRELACLPVRNPIPMHAAKDCFALYLRVNSSAGQERESLVGGPVVDHDARRIAGVESAG